MKYEICLRLLYCVKQITDVGKQIQRLNAQNNLFVVKTISKYWKDPSLFECDLCVEIDGLSKEECCYACLMTIQIIGKAWIIYGPFENENGTISLDGIFSDDHESHPLKWASFSLISR
jgi:hypothetical protein